MKGETLSVACAGLDNNADTSKAPPKADLKLVPLIGTKCVPEACYRMNSKVLILVGANGLEPLTLSV